MIKKWENYRIDEENLRNVAIRNGISLLLARVLINRGIDTDEKVKKFLYPKLTDLYDPFLLNDMDKATNVIIDSINNKEHITIYGDYDVDGITSISILIKFFKSIGVDVSYYLPNRLFEGYGLNSEAIDILKKRGTNLLITVDCGISGHDEIEYAKELGIKVIVTDHHECSDSIPNAIAVIDHKRKDNTYPCNSLAGVGVAFKLIQALCIKMNLPNENFLRFLDIVCLGTVADIVPLIDENRVIVKYGLEKIKETTNVGLKALIGISGYNSVDSTAISFGLAPRINACGRMGEAELALKLLLTNDEEEALSIATRLQEMNKERQEIEKRIMEEAKAIIERDRLYEDSVIVVGSENWHHGVIGIVASKITELYYKPSILICIEGDEGKGSGRSIDGFDLHGALNQCSDSLIRFGGHEMAIGLTIDKNKIDEFREKLKSIANDVIPQDSVPVIKVDSEITSKEISVDTVKSLSMLQPYGESNNAPVFVYRNIKVDSIRTLSDGKHLKLNVKDGNTVFDAIAFNMGDRKDSIHMGDRVDILHYLEINKYNGLEKIQLNVKDIKKSL